MVGEAGQPVAGATGIATGVSGVSAWPAATARGTLVVPTPATAPSRPQQRQARQRDSGMDGDGAEQDQVYT